MIHPKYRRKTRLSFGAWGLTAVSWVMLAALVVLVDPEIFAGYIFLPIWPLVWLSLVSSTWLVAKSGKRGVIYGTAGTVYLGLRYLGIGYWVYGILLLGLAGVVDWYFSIKVKTI